MQPHLDIREPFSFVGNTTLNICTAPAAFASIQNCPAARGALNCVVLSSVVKYRDPKQAVCRSRAVASSPTHGRHGCLRWKAQSTTCLMAAVTRHHATSVLAGSFIPPRTVLNVR